MNYPQVKLLGRDKMILCLAASLASSLTHRVRPFFGLNHSVKFFYVIHKFLPASIFGNFLFDSYSFIIAKLTLKIHSFKPLRYTCECNNLYKHESQLS